MIAQFAWLKSVVFVDSLPIALLMVLIIALDHFLALMAAMVSQETITFERVSIFQLELTHSATPPKRSEGFKFNKCSYGPTTTQQQAHNRTPAGFSKFIQALNQLNPKLKLRTYSSLQEKGKSNKFNTNPKSERRANYQLHNHSTKHKTTLVRDRVTGEQVGGGRKKASP